MNILILTSGSSSIKYQLIEMPAQVVVCTGLIERVGETDAKVTHEVGGQKFTETTEILTHKAGLQRMTALLTDDELGVINSPDEIEVVGHRVVHGGNSFSDTTLITKEVTDQISRLIPLAPLHNPANLEGIKMAEEIFSTAKQVVVFDTAFHQTIPDKAAKYAIPNKFFEEENIRLYGFHGISHKYVSEQAIEYLGKPTSTIITLHLGNGCSMTAVKDGKSIDHSLGFAPLNGLVMGTRSGDIDHSVIFYLVETLGYELNDVKNMLYKQSGMVGLTGFSDLRDIQREAEAGDKHCQLALEMNAYRAKKYIGAYAAAMNGLDAIVFTAGIGENSSVLRAMICDEMQFLGINLDATKNGQRSHELSEISTTDSTVKVLVIPTKEELEIAKQAYKLVSGSN